MSTYYNGANCDIYIGKGAGKKLLEEISNAKKNVKIISPYLSPFLIKELINLYAKGIQIHLITSDNIEDYHEFNDKNIHQLIFQHMTTDEKEYTLRIKWQNLVANLLYINIFLISALAFLFYLYNSYQLIYGIVPILILFFIRNHYQQKLKRQQIYFYHYTQLFPFKVFISPYNSDTPNNTFIHSKIYIIDDQIAYMGSLNFTSSGTKDNYETRIRTTDKNALLKIIEEFNELFYNSKLPEKDIQSWGSKLYPEPIN
ncbi:MAG: phospholipase D family protein [Chitinophagales bacterium]|nr:phospholipase D family protein [Chitinophagales bacterium]